MYLQGSSFGLKAESIVTYKQSQQERVRDRVAVDCHRALVEEVHLDRQEEPDREERCSDNHCLLHERPESGRLMTKSSTTYELLSSRFSSSSVFW